MAKVEEEDKACEVETAKRDRIPEGYTSLTALTNQLLVKDMTSGEAVTLFNTIVAET